MENNFAKNKVILDTTQKELLKTIIYLKNVKLPSNELLKDSFKTLNDELDRIGNLFKDNNKILEEDKNSIQNKLSNFDKFLNDVPNVDLDFNSVFNKKIKVQPLLKININAINNIDYQIEKIRFEKKEDILNIKPITETFIEIKPIVFNKKEETLNIKPITETFIENKPILFIKKEDALDIKPITEKLVESKPINFNERKEKIILPFENLSEDSTFNFEKKEDLLKLDNILNISLPLEDLKYNKMKFDKNYFDDNKELIQERIINVGKEIEFIENFTKKLKIKIEKIKLEFNTIKINVIKTIRKEDMNYSEMIEIDGLEENLESFIPKIYDNNSTIVLNNRNYYLESVDFDEDNFISNLLSEEQKAPIRLVGGNLESFIILSKKYEDIIIKRKEIIEDFKETINEYNVMFIQYFNYKFFLIKNMQKFYKTKRVIYQFLSHKNFQKYYKILIHLNTIISNPKKIFETKIPIIVNNTHTIMYFKHFLIIKILFNLFVQINTIFKDENSFIDIFAEDELSMFFLIFNLYYKILDKYNEIFRFNN